jgi:hypothetical protein
MASELIPRLTLLNDNLIDYNNKVKTRDEEYLQDDPKYLDVIQDGIIHHRIRVRCATEALVTANFHVQYSYRFHKYSTYSHDKKHLFPPEIQERYIFDRIVGQHTIAACISTLKFF